MIYTEQKIKELIQIAERNRSETNCLEFKDARGGFSKNIWKSISSFSHNPEGGVILYGVKEQSEGKVEIVGDLNIARLQERVSSFFVEEMMNAETPEMKIINYKGHDLLAVIINPVRPENKPCYYKNKGMPEGACIRIGNVDKVISLDQLKDFIRHSAPFKFDKTQAINTTMEMLDLDSFKNFVDTSAKEVGRSIEIGDDHFKILANLKLADYFGKEVYPTVAGFLIFSKDNPQLVGNFSRYVIRCVRYAGETVSSPIVDKLDVKGTLDKQINTTYTFIMRNISVEAELKGSKRIETYSYPEEAIREIVANAVVHRDYQITETYTQVNIFSNRIEISNAGNLPPGISIENIKDAQFSRNEVIASTLKDMHYMEEYGRGIDLVYSKMRERDLLEPLFKNKTNSFKVTLLGKDFKDLNPSQVSIWQKLQDQDTINISKCLEMLPDRSRQSLNNDLRRLVEKGLIEKKGSSNNTYYQSIY